MQNISAQAIVWNGGNGNWNVPSNWDCSCIPGMTDSVTIISGTVTIPAGVPVFTELITVSSVSTLINHDTLTVANAGADGLIIQGSFENYGKLIITEALDAGLSIQTTGEVNNHGIIEIDSVNGTNISLEGNAVLINNGVINILAAYDHFGLYDESSGYIVNAEGAQLHIIGGYPFASAISLDGLMINEGSVSLYHGDFDGLGKLINHGDFHIDHPLEDPEQGIQLARLINEAEGNLTVRHTSTWAFVFNDTIINHGLIEVSNTATDAFNITGTYVINHGTILMDSIDRYGILTGLNTVFRNESGAYIRIANSLAGGLRIERIELYNNGIIVTDTVGSSIAGSDHGIECAINGSMFNDTLGQILIDSCYASGLSLVTAFPSTNHGLIHTRRTRQNGVSLSGNHQLFNSGTIDIDSLQGVGIILATAATEFHNTGKVIIGPTMDLNDYSINNSSVFINDTCGHISTVNKLRNNGTFTNHGFLKNRSTNAHLFTTNGPTTNEGVIEDYNGFIFANANTNNNGIIVNARTSTGCPSYMLSNAMSLGSNTDFTVTGIYADCPARSPVATYDSLANIALQTDIFPATADWLWVVRNVHSECEDTIRMKVIVACPVTCSTGNTNYWTGCLNTSDWNGANNWTTGVPVLTHDVVIPFVGSRPNPILASGTIIHSLELRKGTEVTLETGALLSIQ